MAKKKRAKKSGSGKKRKSGRRKSHKRSNPAVKHTRRRSGRRRSHAARPVKRRRSGRRRSNPGSLTWTAMGAATLGGVACRGARVGIQKIPSLTGYTYLAIDAVAPFVIGVAAAFLKMPNVGAGACGVGGDRMTENLQAAYALMQAKKAAAPAPAPGAKGFGTVRQFVGARAVNAGMGAAARYAR